MGYVVALLLPSYSPFSTIFAPIDFVIFFSFENFQSFPCVDLFELAFRHKAHAYNPPIELHIVSHDLTPQLARRKTFQQKMVLFFSQKVS